MKTTKEKIEVMQAHEDGKEIEFQVYGTKCWTFNLLPHWQWSSADYRIKPEPQTRTFYLNIYPNHYTCSRPTKENADLNCGPDRIACKKVTVEFFEGEFDD